MAAYMGKDGLFNIGAATVAYIDSWTLNGDIVTPEITGFGNSSKAYGSAIRGWTISGNGTLDRSDTDQADLLDQFEDGVLGNIAIRLYTQAANYWSGNVRLTGLTVNSQVGDKVAVTFNGNGNGDLSYT